MLYPRLLVCAVIAWGIFASQSVMGQESDGLAPAPPTLRRLARRIEPSLDGQPERINQYIELFRNELANDPRLFVFDVRAESEPGGKVTLTGFVEFPETRDSLAGFLGELGFDVENRLQTLPAAELGERKFGFLKISHCLSYDHPRGRRSVVSDCLYAEPLYLLREDGDQMLVHSGEGYLGYIPTDAIHRVTEAEFTRYVDGSAVRLTADFPASAELTIPVGARLKWVQSLTSASIQAELPTGEELAIPAEVCRVYDAPTDTIEKIIKTATQLTGTKYVWGGRSAEGIDCSGLVQVAYATVGWHLPRDSNQQVYLGRLTGTRWHTSAMRSGDTMYFLGEDGRIRHTAIYLGDGKYINAESPGVRVGSMDPADELYDHRRQKLFAFAKRLVE